MNHRPAVFLSLLAVWLGLALTPALAEDIKIIFRDVRPYVAGEDTLEPATYPPPSEYIPQLFPLTCLGQSGTPVFFKINPDPAMVDITAKLNDGAGPCFTMDEDRDYPLSTNADDILGRKDEILAGWKKIFQDQINDSGSSLNLLKDCLDLSRAQLTLNRTQTIWTVTEADLESAGGSTVAREVYRGTGETPTFNFKMPTDPFPALTIHVRACFSWQIEIPVVSQVPQIGQVGRLIIGNDNEFLPDFIRIDVLDRTPPSLTTFAPSVLFGTTGDHLTDFNSRRQDRNITAIPTNDDSINIMAFDNARYGILGGRGVLHDRARIHCLVYFETFINGISKEKSKIGGREPSRVEKMSGEYFIGDKEPPQGIGRFVWVGPVNLAEYYTGSGPVKDLPAAVSPKSIPGTISDNPEDNEGICVHQWKVPIADLEKTLRAKLHLQYKDEVDPARRATLLSHAFASNAAFSYYPPETQVGHWVEDVIYYGDSHPDGLHLGGYDVLRMTVAVSDASGNWLLPETEMLGWDAREDLIKYDYKYKETVSGVLKPYLETSANTQALLQHRMFMPVVVFDNDRPNPMLLVTAKGSDGSTRTTRFYIPNGDLADLERYGSASLEEPWVNDFPAWEFDAAGESETMKWLKDHDRERYEEYKKALEIQENSRVVFEVVSYDNVNKWVIQEDPFCYFGIMTPIAYSEGARDDSMIRPVTWTIIDPTTEADPQLASLLFEDPTAKTYVYPDYVYRNAEDGKEYGVEFVVHDRSNFNDPDRNGGVMNNWRRLKLKFKILKDNATWKGIEKLGSKEQVDHDAPDKPGE